jgi:hypothetical protein
MPLALERGQRLPGFIEPFLFAPQEGVVTMRWFFSLHQFPCGENVELQLCPSALRSDRLLRTAFWYSSARIE